MTAKKKKRASSIIPMENISQSIVLLRGQKVMLDADLAALYSVETKTLVQAVKRNIERFPEDFMFQLTKAGVCQLEIPICDLKLGRSPLPALHLYRTERRHALQCTAQQAGRAGQYRNHGKRDTSTW